MRFAFADQSRRERLADIAPLSLRAHSWLARSVRAGGIADRDVVQIAGAVAILSGLDYHHDQFIVHVARLTPYFVRQVRRLSPPVPTLAQYRHPTKAQWVRLGALDHEAVAYLNRVGQFLYFAKAVHLEHLTPRMAELLSFRHKYTAHRSIDMPKGESVAMREGHAMTFGFYRQLTKDLFPMYQLQDRGEHIQFHMRNDHPIAMTEGFKVFQAIHALPPDA